MHTSGDLVTSPISGAFFEQHLQRYPSGMFAKNGCMDNTVAFMDGTVIEVARPSVPYVVQLILYSGHRKKHAIKFQGVKTPEGLCPHLHGPEMSRRRDMYL